MNKTKMKKVIRKAIFILAGLIVISIIILGAIGIYLLIADFLYNRGI